MQSLLLAIRWVTGGYMARIVLAEDELPIADIMGSFLENAGHDIRLAAHGLLALDMVRQWRPALLITDYRMPVMDGGQLAEAVRADAALRDLPILLVSGAQMTLAMERADLFDRFLPKPYRPSQLLELVTSLTRSD